MAHQAVGTQCAGVLDQRTHHTDIAAVCQDLPKIGCTIGSAGDLDRNARGAGIHQLHGVACRQDGLAPRRGDDALVIYVGCNEVDATPGRCGDRSLIQDRPGIGCRIELQFVGKKIGVGQIKRGGNQSRHVDFRPLPHQDTGRIDQEYPAVGLQHTQ